MTKKKFAGYLNEFAGYLNVEPDWRNLQRAVERGHLKPDVLRRATDLASEIRKYQLAGKVVTLYPDGKIAVKAQTRRLKKVV